MTTWADILVAGLWRAGWAVVPVALVVAAVCRFGKCNATTRHALWLTTMAGLMVAMWLPGPTVEPPPLPEPVYFIGNPNSGSRMAPPESFVPVVHRGLSKRDASDINDKATTAQVAAYAEPTPPRTAACSADSSAAWLASTANRLRRLSIPLLQRFEQGREWVREFDSDAECRCDASCKCNRDCDAAIFGRVNSPLVNAASSTSNWFASIPRAIAGALSEFRGEVSEPVAVPSVQPSPGRHPLDPSSMAKITSALSASGIVCTTTNADELDPWPGEPGAEFSATAEWQRFASSLLGVRDAVGLVPPFPTTAWAVGFVGMGLLLVVRTMTAMRRLRRAEPADADTLRLVEREARRLGLKTLPETMLIDDRVSPLIWCGRRVRLILPKSFWSDLDYDGRRAVICHELAHLRRRDHWVRRIELFITCLYWWHPVVWWARARLAEEADACCDEWVTWVLPRERRAYARALLAATDFVSGSVAPKPFAVAMASARAAKIARRLTMIMTATRRPSLGLAGICGIVALAALVWVATPAQSCPPEEQGVTTSHNRSTPAAQTITVKARNTGETGDGDESDDPIAGDPEMADRLRRIEESQKRLAAELRELSKHMEKHGASAPAASAGQGRSLWSTTPAPSAPTAVTPMIASRTPFAAAGQGGGYSTVIAGPRPGFEQPVVSRTYKLSGDRLEALTEIMVRDDVPVLVSPTDEGIEVHGTEAQQAVFAAFIKMITANEKAAEINLPEDKLAAVKKLAALSSVPTKFQIGENSISVQGSPAEQAVFDAFIALIHPKTPAGSAGSSMSMMLTPAVSPVPPVPPVSPFAPATPATPAPGSMKRKPGKPKAAQPALAPGSAAAEIAAEQVASAELAKVRSEIEQSAAMTTDLLVTQAKEVAAKKPGLTDEAASIKNKIRAELEAKRVALQARRDELKAQRNALEGQADHLEAEADTVEARAEKADKSDEAQHVKQAARDMRRGARQSRRDATRLDAQIDKLVETITQMEVEAAGAGR